MPKTSSNSIIKLLFFYLLLNSFTLILSSSIPVDYETETGTGEIKVDEASELFNFYYLNFINSQDKPNYVRITLTPNDGQSTPYLCYSPSDENCDKDRIIYTTKEDKTPVFACVRKNEINSSGKKVNVKVTCKTEKCGFNLKFEKADRCQLNADTGTVYSFVASNENSFTEFEIMGKSKIETFMYIGIEGSNSAKVKVSGKTLNSKNSTYEGAYFFSYQINVEQTEIYSIAEFTIEDTVPGELIKLTVYTMYDSKAPDNLLYPGGPSIIGYASQNEFFRPELCLPVSAFAFDEFENISRYYITGKIYSQYALFWISDENGEYLENAELEINDGLLAFMFEPKRKKSSICFEYSKVEQTKNKDVLFSVQIMPMAIKDTNNFYYIQSPMMVGQSYRHIIQKGKTLAYSPAKLDKDKIRYSLNIFRRKGITRAYAIDCDDYPNCEYNMDEGDTEIINSAELILNIGKISLYDRKIEKTQEALDKNKTVFIITCLDDDNDESGYCEFDTSFYYTNQAITLINGENMAKFVPKGQEGQFKIFFNNYLKLESVGVEIMIHNGEILFDGKIDEQGQSEENPTVTKYILSNKVFLYYQLYKLSYEYLYVKYKAIKDSFFTIKYVYNKLSSSNHFINETIYPGESYLVEIQPDAKNKTVHVLNDKNKDGKSFLTNFFALNCDFKVRTLREQDKEEEIAIADGYGQDILSRDNGTLYKSDYYNYTISIEKEEQSNYNNKMCMMYVAGTKVEDMILIGNNINQQIIFADNFKIVKFIYPLPNNKIDLVVYANIIDKAYYRIIIAVDSTSNAFVNVLITKSTPFYIRNDEFIQYCKPDTFCNILISVEMAASIQYLPRTNPMIEITVREPTQKGIYKDHRVPTYMQKGIAKKDFTTGDGYYYLYTDLGLNDEGDVTVNFYRDYGEVYGRIVKKDTPDSDISNYEWMDSYRLPSSEWEGDDKNFNRYLKKYHIDKEDTADCINGCYLILGIIISQIGDYAEDWKFYPFSIITQISESTSEEDTKIFIITIQVDEFIIGNVNIAKDGNISQFYQVWLPRDTYQVQFDWQSEVAGLYINVDDSLPTPTNADFILRPNGTDSILFLEKQIG